jgi:hypothetical protein
VKNPGKIENPERGCWPACGSAQHERSAVAEQSVAAFFGVVGMRLNRSFQKKRAFMLRNLEKTFMMAVLSQFWPRKTVKTGFSVSFRQFGKKASAQRLAFDPSWRDDLFRL